MNKNLIIGAALTIVSGILMDYGNCPGLTLSFCFLTGAQWIRIVCHGLTDCRGFID